jgi:hypothetical protein
MNSTTITFQIYKNYLTSLFNFLRQNKFPFIVLKGWSFIPDLYPDPTTRPFTDVDILIHPQDYPAVTAAMASLGFVHAGSKPVHLRSKPTSPHIPLEITFSHPAGIHIDLHTHLLTLAWWQPVFPIDLHHVWHTAQPYQDSTGLQLQRLSPEVTFLHLCLHLWNHEPLNPRHHSYIDLVLLLRKYSPTMHWDHILHLADQWGIRNILYWVTQILRREYKITFPIQIDPKSPSPSFQYKFIQSKFSKSVRVGLVPTPKLVPALLVPAPPPWFSAFLLRLALIDHPSLIPKLFFSALFPNPTLRTAIHNQPRTLLQHWQTYTHRLLKS